MNFDMQRITNNDAYQAKGKSYAYILSKTQRCTSQNVDYSVE